MGGTGSKARSGCVALCITRALLSVAHNFNLADQRGGSMQVAGTLRVGEAAPVAARVQRRTIGSTIIRCAIAVVPPIAAGFLGGMGENELWQALGRPDGDILIGYFLGAILGWLAWRPLYLKWSVSRFRKRFAALGQSTELPLSIDIQPDVLRYTIGGVDQRAQWQVVTELFRVPGYWVFLVQGTAAFAPQRFFKDATEERAFLAEALAHMSEAARSRSAPAQAFAASAKPAP